MQFAILSGKFASSQSIRVHLNSESSETSTSLK